MKNFTVFSLIMSLAVGIIIPTVSSNKFSKNIRKVFAGTRVKSTSETPWVVTVSTRLGSCSGTLISSRHILTAGHCFLNINKTDGNRWLVTNEYWRNEEGCNGADLTVPSRILDQYYFKFNSICAQCQESNAIFRKASKVVLPRICANYNSQYWWGIDDLAIVELSEDVQFSSTIKPAIIGNFNLKSGERLLVAGYGSDPTDGSIGILKYEWTEGLRQCYTFQLDGWICTAAGVGEQRTCSGDSGAGAMVNLNNEYQIVGIVHGGTDCTGKQGVDFYVSILKYMSDICTHTNICT